MSKQHIRLPLFLLVVICMAAPSAFAQSTAEFVLLDETQYERLNDTAKAHYDQGLDMLNVVDHKLATEAFERASQAQPGHLDLAFLVADMAKDYARRTYGEESDKFFQIANNAIERISRRTDLDMLTQARVERLEQMMEREARGREERDSRRMEIGMQINLQVAAKLGLEPSVLQGRPRNRGGDPRAPFNVRSLSGGAAAGPAGVGLGPNPFAAPAAGSAGGQSPFAAGPGAGAGAGTGAAGSPFGGAPPAAGGSPFGGGTPAAGGSPFGGGAAAAPAGGSPFGAAPATTPAAGGTTTAQNPFGN